MHMENKITKKDRFNQLLAIKEVSDNKALVEFINHELELLEKKSNGKPTKGQEENDKIKKTILEVFTRIAKKVTITELGKESELTGFSNQKLSALCNQMVKDGKLQKVSEKTGTIFFI